VNVKPDAVDWTDTVYWDAEAAPIPGEFYLEAGDLVFGMDRPFVGDGVRVAAISSEDLPALLLQRVMRIRPDDENERGYMRYVMSTDVFFRYLEPLFTGVSVPHVSEWQVRKFKMPLPPVHEQRRIVAHLDEQTARIDRLIEEQQRLIEMLRERRTAVVDAALMPSGTWLRTTLKYMLTGIDQGVSPQAEAGLADESGTWGVLKTGCVNRGTFRQQEHKRLPDDFAIDPTIAVGVGDVIVSRANGSPDLVGSAAIVEDLDYQLILSDKLFRLRPQHSVDPRFLAWSLNSGRYRIQVQGAISGAEGLANNLPLSKLRAFEMHHPLPDEQRRIAAYLDEQIAQIDSLIAETERFIELALERRAALITAAVTGQIDVWEMT
jgi:type I restriction enzyme S subunit